MTKHPINILSETMLHEGFGVLNYRNGNLALELQDDFTAYYRWLFGNRDILLKPNFGSHITVTKGVNASKYQGEKVNFIYSHLIRVSGDTTQDRSNIFYFLDAWSDELIKIRKELGLKTWFKFHITIGRVRY